MYKQKNRMGTCRRSRKVNEIERKKNTRNNDFQINHDHFEDMFIHSI